jgi:biopolymer transport protein ExbB/TolQ
MSTREGCDPVTYFVTHPQAIIYQVATALLYPVLFAEVLALAWVVFEFGRFCIEMLRIRRITPEAIEGAVAGAREDAASGTLADSQGRLTGLNAGWLFKRFFADLDMSALNRTRLLKELSDLELMASKRLERTRLLVRLGPMLGLMGTLIPISPALVALAQGDVDTLSRNLVIAFSTTVVGLLIGGFAYAMTAVRDRRYAQDLSDIEYALDIMEVSV